MMPLESAAKLEPSSINEFMHNLGVGFQQFDPYWFQMANMTTFLGHHHADCDLCQPVNARVSTQSGFWRFLHRQPT
jgi:hypothetical protein